MRFFGAVTEELEEVGQAALAFDEAGEAGFEGVEAGEGFFFEESGVEILIGVTSQHLTFRA